MTNPSNKFRIVHQSPIPAEAENFEKEIHDLINDNWKPCGGPYQHPTVEGKRYTGSHLAIALYHD